MSCMLMSNKPGRCWVSWYVRFRPERLLKLRSMGTRRWLNNKGPSLVGPLDSSCRYNRSLSCLGCSSQPNTKYYFPRRTFFTFLLPFAQQIGEAGVLGRLSLCLWFRPFYKLMRNFSISLCCFRPKLSEKSNFRTVTYSTLPIVFNISSALHSFLLIDGLTGHTFTS